MSGVGVKGCGWELGAALLGNLSLLGSHCSGLTISRALPTFATLNFCWFSLFFIFSIASGGQTLYCGVTVRWFRHLAWNPAVPLSTCMAAPVTSCHGASAPPVMWGGWQCLPGRAVTRSHVAALRADAVGDCLQGSSMTGIPNTQVALLIGC